ncbi:DMT family transporter [Aquiflexum gelatinilyticum]|uniref:EamA family transporter n=1 Tax=Aquiflexum gelatinilyticum TaxID=2961943 RepID=A0A9X2P5P1_9BACT|nr:EamA family transporter [Aquiflexum gelatinilyticum]MCR9015301.1 EamA family transporter [Aquiflexum gelatinilyticum]
MISATLPAGITSKKSIKGFSMALAAAVFWGVSGTCAQFLFEQKGINPAWLVCWRLLLAGIILMAYTVSRKNSDAFKIWKTPKDALQLLFFSIFGMVAVQYTYFYSINLSNAATATVLQYIGPLIVVAFYAIHHRRWPILVEYASLVFALTGTFLLVTHGSFKQLVISEKALFWGILSAFSLAFYTIQPVRLLRKYSAATVTGWGMLIGGIAFSFISKPWDFHGTWDLGTWSAFAYIVLFGSVIAFYFFLTSVTIIGAQTASLLCSVEPLSAAAVAVVWLNVSFGAMDWLGTLFILITIFLLTKGTKDKF